MGCFIGLADAFERLRPDIVVPLGDRFEIMAATNDAGLMTRPIWTLMHQLAPYRNCPKMGLSVAESLGRRLINLPSSAQLGFESGS